MPTSPSFAGKEPTHRDIAKLSGLAASTVSLALRSDSRVSAATIKKVTAIAQRLGYRPNPTVSMWMAHVRRTSEPQYQQTLAYIRTVPKGHSFRRYAPFDLYWEGVKTRARELGYGAETIEWHDAGMSSARIRSILQSKGIRGIIFEYAHLWDLDQYTLDFDMTGFCGIVLGTRPRGLLLHRVTTNYFDGVMKVYARLRELGYERIGLSLHQFTDETYDNKIAGGFLCAQSLPDSGQRIPVHTIDVFQGWDREGFFDWYSKWKPDVVISPNIEIRTFINDTGARIPEDVGFVDLEHSRPSESAGLDHHPQRLGATAVDLLSGCLHSNETGVSA